MNAPLTCDDRWLTGEIESYTLATATVEGSLASAAYNNRLEAAVNERIRHGWVPHGSMVVAAHGDTLILIQPMVRNRRR